jgi:ribosomal protein S18 acetylase RimI-like enzyme
MTRGGTPAAQAHGRPAAHSLRPCTGDDEAFARSVHREAYFDVVTRQFGEWDDERQRGFFEAKWDPASYRLIVVDGADAGVLRYSREAGHIYLDEIQLLPMAQGSGVGSAVIRDLQEQAQHAGLPLRLQVLKQNRARALYERLGFYVTGESEQHVQMEWRFAS